MRRSAWEEAARLRTEVAAAWKAVERTELTFKVAPSDQTQAQAHAALWHWSRTSRALFNAIEECLKCNSEQRQEVRQTGSDCV
jgi:hypothetical protein